MEAERIDLHGYERAHLNYYDGRQRRALRLKTFSSMKAALESRPCEVLNVSVSGALVLVDAPLAVRSVHPLWLGVAAEAVGLTAVAVRTAPSRETGKWETAISFGELSSGTQLKIAAMLVQILQTSLTATNTSSSKGKSEAPSFAAQAG